MIETTGEFFMTKGKTIPIGRTPGKFAFVLCILLIGLHFYHFCRILINLSGGCDHLNSHLVSFDTDFYHHQTPSRIGHLGLFLEFSLSYLAILCICQVDRLSHYLCAIFVCDIINRNILLVSLT